jgi:RND superfamily putative drug exporter
VGPWLILAAWLLIALAAAPFAAGINDELDASVRLAGSESARVDAALRQEFKSPFGQIALLRIGGAPAPRSADGRTLLGQVTAAIRRTPGVQGAMSYLDREDALFIGQDGSAMVIVGVGNPTGSTAASAALMVDLRRLTDALELQLSGMYPQITFEWTGEAAVNADMRRMSAEETRTAELRVLPITLALLLIAFRSVIAACVPILCGALTILVALAALAVLNRFWPVSILVYSIVSMVGLGLSIDYALLIVTRYRDAVDQGLSRPVALFQAAEQGGRTVLVSGSAVGVGFAAMLIVRVSEVRSIGIAGLVVTTLAVLVARTFLPAMLACIGRGIDAGHLGRGPRTAAGQRWRSWANWIGRHPSAVLLIAGGPLVLLAAQAVHLRTDLPRGRWLPDSAESVRVLHELDAVARGNFGQMIPIILRLPAGVTIEDESGWRAESRLVRFLARDARIAHVWAATSLSAVPLGGPEILRRVPPAELRSLVTADGRAVLLQVLPRQGLAATDAASLVRELRGENPQRLTGLAGTRLEAGGVPGFNVDYHDAIENSLVTMVASVIGATLLVLSLAFRSALIPVKAVALNLLSVAASFGAVALVFQSPYGSQLVGLPRPLDGGFPIVPILVFCIVFGLSMDYEVFIVARIADGRAAGLTDREALAEGLVGSGRVITFAAAIMVTIFGGFVFGNFVLIKILGFALGVAVLLDATVVRLILGPALIHLAGRWNWWPGSSRP